MHCLQKQAYIVIGTQRANCNFEHTHGMTVKVIFSGSFTPNNNPSALPCTLVCESKIRINLVNIDDPKPRLDRGCVDGEPLPRQL